MPAEHTNLPLVTLSMSIHTAMKVVDECGKGIALVVDKEHQLLSTITDGDIRRAILARIDLDLEVPVAELLAHKADTPYPTPVTARLGTECAVLLKLMQERSVRHVPLLDVAGRVDLVTLDELLPDPVIQECIDGEEITMDVFSDWSGKPIITVPRKRLKVREGEVSVGRVERNSELEQLCKALAKRLGTVGPINIQAIRSKNSIHITEINPRFGGGCPLNIAAGTTLAEWVILMALQPSIPGKSLHLRDGLTMMRFDTSFFYFLEDLIS